MRGRELREKPLTSVDLRLLQLLLAVLLDPDRLGSRHAAEVAKRSTLYKG